MTLQNWKQKGQFFKHHNHHIFYMDEGKGEVLLLIHGFPTASWDWWQMWESLLKDHRLIAMDMIGFGFSDKPQQYNYSILDQADLHELFLQKQNIHKVRILCHDYGDTVTQELLARFHDRHKAGEQGLQITSICFLNGGLFPETHHPRLIQTLLISPIGRLISRLFTREKLGKNFKQIFGPNTQPTESELDDFWELIQNNNGRGVMHLLIRYMAERKQYRERWVGAIQNASIPIRLIDGAFDPISGQNMVDRYLELIPDPDVVVLKDIGHFPLVEAPDEVTRHYLEFIKF